VSLELVKDVNGVAICTSDPVCVDRWVVDAQQTLKNQSMKSRTPMNLPIWSLVSQFVVVVVGHGLCFNAPGLIVLVLVCWVCTTLTLLSESEEESEPPVLTPDMEKWLLEVAHPQLAHLGRNQFAKGKVWAQLTSQFNELHGVQYERHFLQAQLRLLNSKNAGNVFVHVIYFHVVSVWQNICLCVLKPC
jgi:hypothetical protein